MPESSAPQPAIDTPARGSSGRSSRASWAEDDFIDEAYYNELVAGADERDRETLAVPRIGDVWDMDSRNEDEDLAEFNMPTSLPLDILASATSPWDASIPQLYHNRSRALMDDPWGEYDQEAVEDTCPPQQAARTSLSGLTNLDFSSRPHISGSTIPPLAPTSLQQKANDENRPLQPQGSQVRNAAHAFARLPQPQHGTAFALAHLINVTGTQGLASLPTDSEGGDSDEINANGGIVGPETNDFDEALPAPKSSPVETASVYSEATTQYWSEPQGSPASSPPSEVAESPCGPIESFFEYPQEAASVAEDATDSQLTPSEELSAPSAAATEEPASGSKPSSRKRCLSEAGDQPRKRPASESKVASNTVDNETLVVAYAAPASPGPLPAAGTPTAPTTVAPSHSEAAETATPNPAPGEDVLPTSAPSLSPRNMNPVASADINLGVEPSAPAALSDTSHHGGYQDAHGATDASSSSASGSTIPTPPLVQTVTVDASNVPANTGIPANPALGSSLSTPSGSSSNSTAPRGNNKKQPKGKKDATTKKKRKARSDNSRQPWNQGPQFTLYQLSKKEKKMLDRILTSGSPLSDDVQRTPNSYFCYLILEGKFGSDKVTLAAWNALDNKARLPYERVSAELGVRQANARNNHT